MAKIYAHCDSDDYLTKEEIMDFGNNNNDYWIQRASKYGNGLEYVNVKRPNYY